MYCHHGVCLRAKFTLPDYYVECVLDGVVQDIYADSSGTPIVSVSGVANRAKADSRGNFNFHVDGGTYDLRYYDPNGVYQFTETGFSMLDLPPSSVETSAGAADTGKGVLLNASGALDRTLLAPDGFQKALNVVLSDTGDVGDLGTFTGTLLGSLLRVHGTDQSKIGAEFVKWGNDSKGSRIVFGKSRGTVGNFASLNAADRVTIFDFQGAGTGSQFGHVANLTVEIDGTPATAGELPGAVSILTGTGSANGLRTAVKFNKLQQAYFPGKNTLPATVTATADTDYGALNWFGENATDQSLFRLTLTGAALRTTPQAGHIEHDSSGVLYITDVNGKRDVLTIGQIKAAGDSGAIAAGAAAGTGPTISVDWGYGCATVTLTTGTSPTTGDLFTLTFPHTFATRAYAFLQGANDNAATYVGRNLGVTTSTSNVLVRAPLTAPAASTQYVIHVFYQGN